MSITAASLLAIGNERTGRSESQADVDKFITSAVADLSTRGIALEAEETVTLTTSDPSYLESAFTNPFKKIDAITIVDSDSNESDPLTEISWQRYKERVAQGTANDKPKEYARFAETIYIWPPPNATTYPSMKISGTIYHADSTTISFANRFRECLTQYVIAKIYEKYGISEKAKYHIALYADEFNKLLGDQNSKEISMVRYNDI